jgi:hypothetical protein
MRDDIESAERRTSASARPGAQRTHGNTLVDKVRDTAAAQLTSQKDRVTEGLGTVVNAVRQSGEQLRQQQHDTIADYAEQAASQIERLSQGLRDKDLTEILGDVQRLSRSQPALFIGGAFALGVIGARFFKSSSRSNWNEPHRQWNGPTAPGGDREIRGYARASGPIAYGSSSSFAHDAPTPVDQEVGMPTPAEPSTSRSADTGAQGGGSAGQALRSTQNERA